MKVFDRVVLLSSVLSINKRGNLLLHEQARSCSGEGAGWEENVLC
jgi:hypothetical protein